jgi:ABC-type dipeptide/oligopeptide/nickel transport system ATPase subunit
MPIHSIYIDTFQSESTKQFLERNKVQVIKQSVDSSITPYQFLNSLLHQELLKGGRNIFLRNNLSCLSVTKTKSGKDKIDHPIGTVNNKYFGDFENSTCGLFAKDVSDSLANAVYGAYSSNIRPVAIYQDENKKFSNRKEDHIIVTQNAVKKIFQGRAHL